MSDVRTDNDVDDDDVDKCWFNLTSGRLQKSIERTHEIEMEMNEPTTTSANKGRNVDGKERRSERERKG